MPSDSGGPGGWHPSSWPRDTAIAVILNSDFPALAAFLGVPVSQDSKGGLLTKGADSFRRVPICKGRMSCCKNRDSRSEPECWHMDACGVRVVSFGVSDIAHEVSGQHATH